MKVFQRVCACIGRAFSPHCTSTKRSHLNQGFALLMLVAVLAVGMPHEVAATIYQYNGAPLTPDPNQSPGCPVIGKITGTLFTGADTGNNTGLRGQLNAGSFFFAEISRMMSSFRPLGTRSSSISVMNPHLYSRSARSRIVSTFVLIALFRR